jgi:hypothetical protein
MLKCSVCTCKGFFPIVSLSTPALRAIQWIPGVLSPGVKRRGSVMLTPSRAEVKNEELYFLSRLAPTWRETGQPFLSERSCIYIFSLQCMKQNMKMREHRRSD